MTTEIQIAAVGDLLMKGKVIDSAKILGENKYSFDPMFQEVAPFLRAADLTIGNLETTLVGRENLYERRNPKTRFPLFNCPDELAPALKKAGFNVLTTSYISTWVYQNEFVVSPILQTLAKPNLNIPLQERERMKKMAEYTRLILNRGIK